MTNGAGKRCVVYVRVSTDDQARHGYSLADQTEQCIRRGNELGYDEAGIILCKDEGISGETVNRPGLNQLRELVADPGSIGHVIIYDPDRFARNLSLQLIVTEEIVKGGATLEFINFEWRDTPEGKLFYSLRGAIAEYEKAKIKERTRRGREQKAKQGLMPIGKDLYGYRFNPETDLLEPKEEEWAVLRLIRDLVLHGAPGEGKPLSCVKAAKWLAEHGVPAPKGRIWYPGVITNMLRNESYTGSYWVLKTDSSSGKRKERPREEQYLIKIPAVWDEATRQELIARIESNKWLKRGRKSQGNYLLRGLIFCGVCGDGVIQMKGNSIVDHRRNYQYYVCYKTHGRVSYSVETGEKIHCRNRHWPAKALDEAVWNRVKRAIENSDEVLGRFNEQRDDRRDIQDLETERAALAGSVAEKETECDRYLRLFAMGHIQDEAKLAALLTPAKRELAALKSRLSEAESALQKFSTEAEELERYRLTLEKARRTIAEISDDDFEAKQEILPKLVKRVIVGHDSIRIIGHLSVNMNGPEEPQLELVGGHAKSCAVRQLE